MRLFLEQARDFKVHVIMANQTIGQLKSRKRNLTDVVEACTAFKHTFRATDLDSMLRIEQASGEAGYDRLGQARSADKQLAGPVLGHRAAPMPFRNLRANTLMLLSFDRVDCALAREPMFRAPDADKSGSRAMPHTTDTTNSLWLLRLAFSQCPHSGQVRLVLRGSTATIGTEASVLCLVREKLKSWRNAQPDSRLAHPRRLPLTVSGCGSPLRSSRAIPRPVSLAGLGRSSC